MEGSSRELSAILHGTVPVRFYVIDFANSRSRKSGETHNTWERRKQAAYEQGMVEMEMMCGVARALYLDCQLHGSTCKSDPDNYRTLRIWDGYCPLLWGRFLPVNESTRRMTPWGLWGSSSDIDDKSESRWSASESEGDIEDEEADQEDVYQDEDTFEGEEAETSSASEDDEGSESDEHTARHRRPKLLLWASPRIPLQSKRRMARPAEVK